MDTVATGFDAGPEGLLMKRTALEAINATLAAMIVYRPIVTLTARRHPAPAARPSSENENLRRYEIPEGNHEQGNQTVHRSRFAKSLGRDT
ncbi:MAG: hypothetical protein J0I92_04655 [Phyllobacterium sp.]|nr:hypothetical protein [Phyllobacterium sp.]